MTKSLLSIGLGKKRFGVTNRGEEKNRAKVFSLYWIRLLNVVIVLGNVHHCRPRGGVYGKLCEDHKLDYA